MKRLLPLILVTTLLLSACLNGCQTPGLTPNGSSETTDNKINTPYEGNPDVEETPNSEQETTGGEKDPSDDCETDDEHTDADNNGLCDSCNVSVVIVLDLFAINDLHGKLCDTSKQAGVDEMTTYLKQAYLQEDHVILLSSGDMWQGSSESNLTKGQIVTEWMNELDVVSMTLGNHEYDWGEEYIIKNAELAEFSILAINVYDTDTNERADYCSPSVMVKRGGANIGIIGAIGDCYSSISGEMSSGVYFKTGSELSDLVKAEAQKLRAEGADFIVYSIHDGYGRSSSGVGSISDSQLRSYYDPSLSDGYVDIVFEGHSHQRYVLKDGNGIYHMQGGGDNSGICHAEAVINFANGQSKVQVAEFVSSSSYDHLADDPIVETLMDKYKDQVSVGTRVLGTNDLYRNGDELCNLIAELYVKAGIEEFGESYDIVLGGGYISVRSPYSLPAGQVTYSQLQMLFPFDNELVLCSIKGSDLNDRFIYNSHANYFEGYSDYGNSVKGSIDPDKTYYIIVDTYSSTYAPNRLTEVARFAPGVYARDLLAAYVEAGGLSSGGSESAYTSTFETLRNGKELPKNDLANESYYDKFYFMASKLSGKLLIINPSPFSFNQVCHS